jgi:1-acyl-sn-glycerol-3-phosphate acyltransferase
VTEVHAEKGAHIDLHLLGVTITWRYRVQWFLVRLIVRSLFSVRGEGLEKWPAAPFQLVSNHHSGWDPMFIAAVSPFRPRITWFGPKEVDFKKGTKNRIIGFFGGAIPFHPRKTNLRSALRAVQYVFDKGGVLAITPEGTLGFRETELLPLQDGATLFAAISGVPVLPCAVIGSSTIWFRKRLTVRFGDPIMVSKTDDRAARDALAGQVRAAMLALLPAEEPTYPRRRPAGQFLSDVFNGPREVQMRRAYMAELEGTEQAESG